MFNAISESVDANWLADTPTIVYDTFVGTQLVLEQLVLHPLLSPVPRKCRQVLQNLCGEAAVTHLLLRGPDLAPSKTYAPKHVVDLSISLLCSPSLPLVLERKMYISVLTGPTPPRMERS